MPSTDANSLQLLLIRVVLLILVGSLIDGAVQLVHHRSTFSHFGQWLIGSSAWDSWRPMRIAVRWLNSGQSGTLYQRLFFENHLKFQYPPSSLLPMVVTDRLGVYLSIGRLNRLSWLFFAAQAAASSAIAVVALRKVRSISPTPRQLWAAAALAAVTSLTFYPALKAFTAGQVQTWINAWFVIACLCWLTGRRSAAGVLIGASCLFKPQFLLFLIWGGLRRQGRFLMGMGAVLIVAEGLALAIFGLANHLDYLNALSFMSRHGESYFANQSINGLLNRLLENGDVLKFHSKAFPPYNVVVYVGTLTTSALLVAGAMVRGLRSKSVNVADFIIAGLTFTIASPIAWEHHYGLLPAAFVVLAVTLAAMPPTPARTGWGFLLSAAFLAIAHFLPPTYPLARSWGHLTQSYQLFSGLAVLGMLYVLRDRAPGASEPDDGRPAAIAC